MFHVLIYAVLSSRQLPGATDTLRLADLYRVAAERSPRIAGARALANAARARVAASRRPPDPVLQLGLMNYAVPQWRPMDAVGMAQIQAMQTIPLPGKLALAGGAAESTAEAQADRQRDVAWDVREKVAASFYDLYVTDQSLAIDRQTLRLLDDVLRTTESMYRVGQGRQSDVLRAQVEIVRMSQDTIRMTLMRPAIAARLAALVARDTVFGIPVLPRFADAIPATTSLAVMAVDDRPMLRAAAADVNAASMRARLAAREVWPDLTVGIQYGQRGGMGGTERMVSVMIGASLPIFAKSRQLGMRDEAVAMQQMARAELTSARSETRAAIVEARADLVRARTLASSYRTTLIPQAEAGVESALASYRVGRVDLMTLLDARMNVNRFRKELATLESDEGKAWAELEMLTGHEFTGLATSAAAAGGRAP